MVPRGLSVAPLLPYCAFCPEFSTFIQLLQILNVLQGLRKSKCINPYKEISLSMSKRERYETHRVGYKCSTFSLWFRMTGKSKCKIRASYRTSLVIPMAILTPWFRASRQQSAHKDYSRYRSAPILTIPAVLVLVRAARNGPPPTYSYKRSTVLLAGQSGGSRCATMMLNMIGICGGRWLCLLFHYSTFPLFQTYSTCNIAGCSASP